MLTATINTTDVADGTVLYWNIVPVAGDVNLFDFVPNIMSGTVTINNNTGTITLNIAADQVTEGVEQFMIRLYDSAARTNYVATSNIVTITDTSVSATLPPPEPDPTPDPTPDPVFSITTTKTSYVEGELIEGTATIENVPEGTTMWVSVQPINGNVEPEDFWPGDITDLANFADFFVTTTDTQYPIATTLVEDFIREGIERCVFHLRTHTSTGLIVASTDIISIQELPASISIRGTPATVSESSESDTLIDVNQRFTFIVDTVNYPLGGSIYWDIQTSDGVTLNDFVNMTLMPQEAITVGTTADARTFPSYGEWNSADYGIWLYPFADGQTEGAESFRLILRSGSETGPIIATSNLLTISDTSLSETSYTITTDKTLYDEGEIINVTVNTVAVPDGTIGWLKARATTGAITNDDFTAGTTTFGPLVVNNNQAVTTIGIAQDGVTDRQPFEGQIPEGFVLDVYGDDGTGQAPANVLLATSDVIGINDTSQTPVGTYSITTSQTVYNEGDVVSGNVLTTNVPVGTTLFIRVLGNNGFVGADFTEGLLDYTLDTVGDTTPYAAGLANDLLTEGTETFVIAVYTDPGYSNLVATSGTITVNDTSLATPIYGITVNNTSYNEGDRIEGTATIQNVPLGTTMWVSVEPVTGTVTPDDFWPGDITDFVNFADSFITTTDTQYPLFTTLVEDQLTEGTEGVRFHLHRGTANSPILASSQVVTINDTSQSPVSYSWTFPQTTFNEGDVVGATLTTSGVPAGTVLYATWTGVTGNITAGDFTENILQVAFPTAGNVTPLGMGLRADQLTEGTETYLIHLRENSFTGPIVLTSPVITINDTSKAPAPTYNLSVTSTSLNETTARTLGATVTTTNVPDGTVLYMVISPVSGSITASDFVENVLWGPTTVVNGSAPGGTTIRTDSLTEGTETFRVQVRTGSQNGPVVATSPIISVSDTSKTTVTSSGYHLHIDSMAIVYIATNNFQTGWRVTGTVSPSGYVPTYIAKDNGPLGYDPIYYEKIPTSGVAYIDYTNNTGQTLSIGFVLNKDDTVLWDLTLTKL